MNSAVAAPKLCTTCGARYAADALFCPADGTPLTSAAAAQRGSDAGSGVDPYVGRDIGGHIQIRQLAGVGAMGRVYRAFQSGIDRDVAVKILHRELSANAQLVARFHREAKVASRLQHPNVVQVHMAGQLPDGALYIVMEYLDGLSLQSALAAAGGAMPLQRALHIALQLCDASGEAHAQGVVHRDLKPENVMLVHRVDDPDYVKVLDFGIARLNWGEQSMATAAGLIFGTARYISPEGAQGETVGPMGDVYSIATLVFQMLAGRTPFEGEQAVGLLVQQIHDPPPPLRSIARASYVPEPIANAVMKNLAKDPLKRDPDARAFGRALLEGAKASGLSPEDLVPRSVLLGARQAMQLSPMQRTKQMQLATPIAEMVKARASDPLDLAATVAVSPADLPPEPQQLPQTPPPQGALAQGQSAPTRKWMPSSDFQAQVSSQRTSAPTPTPAPMTPGATSPPGAPPSNVDITLDDASATPAVVLPTVRTVATEPLGPEAFSLPQAAPGHARPEIKRTQPSEMRANASRPGSTEIGEDDVAGLPDRGRWRWIGVVLFCFLLGIGVTTFVAYKMNLLGSSASHASLEDAVNRANDALHQKRWDAPPGDNVRDITNAALAKWPNESRLIDLRERASDELVKEAVGLKLSGDPKTALARARLAHELDASDVTAQKLVDQYEAELRAAQGPIVVLPALDAGVAPSGKAPVTATGNFRAAMDVSPGKPRIGQVVELVVKVTTAAGTAPRKSLDDAVFTIGGAGMGGAGVAKLPASADGNGIFRASFTFLEAGKYEVSFSARGDGLVIKTARVVVAEEAKAAPSTPPPQVAPTTEPPPAPTASVKWL